MPHPLTMWLKLMSNVIKHQRVGIYPLSLGSFPFMTPRAREGRNKM